MPVRQRGAMRPRSSFWPQLRLWLVAAALLLPVYLLYVVNFTIPGLRGTGFLQYDQASYMADARAYFASGHFALTYGLPFSPNPATPRVYFQPLTLAFGLVWKLTGSDPGILYMLAGLVLDLLCARIIIALYDAVVGLDRPGGKLGLLCFFWGGGVLVLTGLLYGWLTARSPVTQLFKFYPYPGGPFWFLNLGSNLLFTTEAFYHLVFLGTILLVLRRRWAAALGGAALLSASHPFTGLQLIAVLGGWSILELTVADEDRAPPYFPVLLAALATAHLGYYMWLLPHVSAEYRSLQGQWSLPWILPGPTLLAAYGPVFLLAVAAMAGRLRRGRGLDASHRLLLVWFFVSLALAKHDLLIKSIQPVHFTRGYIWTPLFLLGAPMLIDLFAATPRISLAHLVAPGIVVGLLLDNAMWLFAVAAYDHDARHHPVGLVLDRSEQEVLAVFRDPRYSGYLVVSQSPELGYLATVYSPLRSWYSHRYNTPDAALRLAQLAAFFGCGAEPIAWRDRSLLIVAPRQSHLRLDRMTGAGFHIILENSRFGVLARPRPPPISLGGEP